MSGENIDPSDLLKSINYLSQLDAELIESLTGLSDSDKAYILAIKADREETERRKKLLASINDSIGDFANLGKSLVSSGSSFGPIKQTINMVSKASQGMAKKAGGIGKAIATVIDVTAKAANHMVESFEKAYTSFEKISGTGLISTFDGLRDMSNNISVSMEQLSSSLEDRGGQLVNWGGTALKGAKEFEKLAKSVHSNRTNFQMMGITVKELTDSQLDYMDLERKSTRGQIQFDMTYKQGFMDYLDNLSTLANLTGQSRDELRKKMAKQQEEANFRLFSMTRDQEQRKNDNALVALMSQMGPTYEEGIKDIMAAQKAGVQATGEASDAVRRSQALGGENIQANVQKYLDGAMTYAELMDKTLVAGGKAVDQLGLGVISMRDGLDKSIMIENANAKILSQKTTKQRLAEAQAAKNKPPKDIDKSLAGARIQMNDTSVAVEQLSTGSETAAKSMRYLAKKMNEAITEIYKNAGKNVPEMLKVTMAESDARDKIGDAKIKLQAQLDKKTAAQEALKTGGSTMSWSDSRKENVKIQDADSEINKLKKELESLTADATKLAQKRKELENVRLANDRLSAVGDTSAQSTESSSGISSGGLSSGGVYASAGPGARSSGTDAQSASAGATSDAQTSGQSSGQSSGATGATGATDTTGAAGATGATGALPTSVGTGPEGWAQVYALAKAAGDKYPEVTASQWALESGWGKSMSGKNNPFGQKAGSQEAGSVVMTREVVNGRSVMMNQKFKDYSSSLEAVAEHVKRWSPKYSNAKSPEEAIAMIARSYATDPSYARTVSQIIRQQKGAIPVAAAATPAAPTQAQPPVISASSSPVMVSGPSTGHNVVMQGDQTVIPANPGTEASAVQTTYDSTPESKETKEFLAMMNTQFSNMIDLMGDKISVQQRSMAHSS
jgi:hypothetical protein